MPRRQLNLFESQLLDYARDHPDGFYGYQIAAARPETPNPTIYRALRRLEQRGYLVSEQHQAEESFRPKKRVYYLKQRASAVTRRPEPKVVWQPEQTHTSQPVRDTRVSRSGT